MSNEFGELIRQRRIEKGLNLCTLAMWAGISKAYLSMIERGLCPPPRDDKVKQLADLLAIHRDDLMYLAHRLPEDVQKIAEQQPEAVSKLVRKNLRKD